MKILIVSSCPTHPVTAGNRKAILNQVEMFKSMDHEVYFLYIDEKPLKQGYRTDLSEMLQYWKENLFIHDVSSIEHVGHLLLKKVRNLFYNNQSHADDYFPWFLNKTIRSLNKTYNFDCCIVNYYFLSKALTNQDIPLRGIYTHDYFAYKSLLVSNSKVGYNTNAHQEAKALQRAPHIFALNSEEANYFQRLAPQSKVYNTYSPYEFYNSEVNGSKVLLFFSGDNEFNLNGLKWFFKEIFPKIKTQIPDIKLIIGGSICRKIKEYENENVILKGFVDDPKNFYDLGDIVINPTYQGTGLKIKTFEGISYGKVVIAHPHSGTGIFNKDSAPVFVSSDGNEWANYIKKIIDDKSKISEIKKLDENYIKAMNNYIEAQYTQFFNSLQSER